MSSTANQVFDTLSVTYDCGGSPAAREAGMHHMGDKLCTRRIYCEMSHYTMVITRCFAKRGIVKMIHETRLKTQ